MSPPGQGQGWPFSKTSGLSQHLQKTCGSCWAASILPLSPNSFSTPAFQLPFAESIFHLTLLPRLFNHPTHLGTSRSPRRTSRPATLAPSPQPQARAFGVAPLFPPHPHFGGRHKKSRGMGASSGGPGREPEPGQPRGMLRRPRRPQRLRGAVANCPRKSPRSTALRRLFF